MEGTDDPVWAGAQHVERWAGEVRVNALRLAAIAAFYAWHLFNYMTHQVQLTPHDHVMLTAAALAWATGGLALHAALSRRYCPPWLRMAAIAIDVVMATAVLTLLDGPKSPLVVVYFLVIASASLRLDLGAVWAATLAAASGYLFLCGYARWVRPELGLRPTRPAEVIFLIGLGAAGLFAGQAVRQARRFAKDYAERMAAGAEDEPEPAK